MNKNKQALQEYYLNKREVLGHGVQHVAAQHVKKHFLAHSLCHGLTKETIIAAYHPIAGELDPLPLLKALRECGMTVALPVIVDKKEPLAFATWHPEIMMRAGTVISHILEPEHQPGHFCTPSLVIVPLLAVDKQGNRLGFGGGYYDRTLADLRKKNTALVTVGVGYGCQFSEENLPVEAHDIALNYFVSDDSVRAF